jgi:hypothetical protein
LARHVDGGGEPLVGVVDVPRRDETTSGTNDATASRSNARLVDTRLHPEIAANHGSSQTPV